MKTEINEKGKTKERRFPKLMIANDGEIVLFLSTNAGTVIKAVEWPIGHHSEKWDLAQFKDFEGSITLSND